MANMVADGVPLEMVKALDIERHVNDKVEIA